MKQPPDLTNEQEQALQEGQGLVQGSSYVLMSVDLYRDIMGLGTDDDLESSVRAVKQAWAEIQDGRSIPMDQVFRELDEKYGVRS